MGKSQKSLTFVSDKKTKQEIKKNQLQKVKKGTNAIKKINQKDKEQLKNDFEELKTLLRLEQVDDTGMEDINSEIKEIKMEHQVKKKKKLLSTKKKNYLRLLATTPLRDETPMDLKDLQISRVKETVKKQMVLSRGQRKRLQKKEKFINQQIMEDKSAETFKLFNEKKKQLHQAQQKKPVEVAAKMDVDMNGTDIKKPKGQKPNAFGDFGGMNSLLDQIKTSVDKKEHQKKSNTSQKKQKAEDAKLEKERLNKIMGLQSFQLSPLDNLYQHINNSINQKIKEGKTL